jgi:predicted RNA binding protein YcfA (HicA-like mRNA interferase family)
LYNLYTAGEVIFLGFTVTVAEVLAFLRTKGYTVQTGKGKHGTKAVKGKQKIPIPIHGGGTLGKGVADKILSRAGYGLNDLIEWRQ